MKDKIFGAMILLCLFSSSRLQDARSVQPVHDVRIEGEIITGALKRVAATYQTVIGFENSEPPPYDKDITITLDHATLAEVMDAIVKSDPRYSWQQQPTGAIRVFSREANFTLPNVVMASLRIEALGRDQTEVLLNASPEITTWMQQHQCSDLQGIVVGGIWPPDTTKITLTTGGKTVRENLDEVVRSLGTYYWVVSESVTEHGCRARILLPAPDLPRRK
jgi:hypothetical protein